METPLRHLGHRISEAGWHTRMSSWFAGKGVCARCLNGFPTSGFGRRLEFKSGRRRRPNPKGGAVETISILIFVTGFVVVSVGVTGLFKSPPVVRLRTRLRAAGWIAVGAIVMFAAAANAPRPDPHSAMGPDGPLPSPGTDVVAVADVPAINRAAWNPLTAQQANALHLHRETMDKCLGKEKGAACVEIDAAKIGGGCRNYAHLMSAAARGEAVNEERTGYLEAQCVRDMQELYEPEPSATKENAARLRNAAKNARRCLGGSEPACAAIEDRNVVGYCAAYGNEIMSVARGRAPDDNLRGYYKAGCERDLLEVGA